MLSQTVPSKRLIPALLCVPVFLVMLGAWGCGDDLPVGDSVDLREVLDVSTDSGPPSGLCGGNECGPTQLCCDDRCVDPLTDISACGRCGHTCEESEECLEGACACTENDGQHQVCGDEALCCPVQGCVPVGSNPLHCGSCGVSCGVGETCEDGACVCGGDRGEGARCGEGQACCSGACEPSDSVACACGGGRSCVMGEACCSGTCAAITRDEEHCGACGRTCHNSQLCADSVCLCLAGLADCDDDPSNGCETQARTNVNHCGVCGHACEAGEVCTEGRCLSSCDIGLTNCQGSCVTLETNRYHCGACGFECQSGEVCVDGICLTDCPATLNNCGGHCVDLKNNRDHCASCGSTCENGEICWEGTCMLECPGALTRCADSCADLSTSPLHCGACARSCSAAAFCLDGRCVGECPSFLSLCGQSCVNLLSDSTYCGSCDRTCDDGEFCSGGRCVVGCPEGQLLCEGLCIDPLTDSDNCGASTCFDGLACQDSEVCEGGQCVCGHGLAECNGDTRDGCEAHLPTDEENCGACDVMCTPAETCCDGACIARLSDRANCGVCGNICQLGEYCIEGACQPGCGGGPPCENINGLSTCQGGECVTSCLKDFADCNLDPSDGCETDLTNVQTCGHCDNICSDFHAVPMCFEGTCKVLACLDGWDDCDGDLLSGGLPMTVSVDLGDGFKPMGDFTFHPHYSTGRLPIGPSTEPVVLRLAAGGTGVAHLDAVTLGGDPPTSVTGATLAKVRDDDSDVDDITGRVVTLTFPPSPVPRELSVNARIEPEDISKEPFQFPPANTFRPLAEAATGEFYTFPLGTHPLTLSLDGTLNEKLGEPLFAEYIYCDTGHPQGDTYGWVGDDGTTLYVALDFTPDNTMDGEADYAQVIVRDGDTTRVFTSRVGQTQWGTPGFTYTPRVSYQHKVYEFAIPLSSLPAGPTLELAFAAYGTAAVGPNNGCEESRGCSN